MYKYVSPRGKSDVDNIEPHADQSATDTVVEHLTRDTGIASDNDTATAFWIVLADYCTIGSSKLYNVEGVEAFSCLTSDCTADT